VNEVFRQLVQGYETAMLLSKEFGDEASVNVVDPGRQGGFGVFDPLRGFYVPRRSECNPESNADPYREYGGESKDRIDNNPLTAGKIHERSLRIAPIFVKITGEYITTSHGFRLGTKKRAGPAEPTPTSGLI
jgi:hypothetical protein